MSYSQLFCAMVMAVVVATPTSADARNRGALIGDALPDVTIPLLSGKGALRLRDVGARVVVSFFSRYCRPCFRELPVLHAVMQQINKGRDAKHRISLVVIAADGPPPPALIKHLSGHGVWVLDRSGVAAAAFKPRRFPCTYIAKAGKIAKINRGFGAGYGARVTRWLRQVFPSK